MISIGFFSAYNQHIYEGEKAYTMFFTVLKFHNSPDFKGIIGSGILRKLESKVGIFHIVQI